MQSNTFYRFMSWVMLFCYSHTLFVPGAYGVDVPSAYRSQDFDISNYTLRVQRVITPKEFGLENEVQDLHAEHQDHSKSEPWHFKLQVLHRQLENDDIQNDTGGLETISAGQKQDLKIVAEHTVSPWQQNNDKALKLLHDKEDKSYGVQWLVPQLGNVVVDWNGSVLLKGGDSDSLTSKIRVETFGNVVLDDLYAKHLQVAAAFVINTGTSKIDRLDVKLNHPEQTSAFVVDEDSALDVKNLNLQGGALFNHGQVKFAAKGQLDLWNEGFFNHGIVQGVEGAAIHHGGVMANYGKFLSSGLRVDGNFFSNYGEIQADNLSFDLKKGGENHATIKTNEATQLKTKLHWRNFGEMSGAGKQTLEIGGDLYNHKQMSAAIQKVNVQGATYNEGTIHGEENLDFSTKHLSNAVTGKIGGHGASTVSVGEGLSEGDIYGRRGLSFTTGGKFINRGKLGSGASDNAQTTHGPLTLDLKKSSKFVNESEGKLMGSEVATSGRGELINHGSVHGEQQTQIKNSQLTNIGVVSSQGHVHLGLKKSLVNEGKITGATGEISGKCKLVNASGTKDEPGLSFKESLEFARFSGQFANKGHMAVGGKIKGEIAQLENRGFIEASQGYDLSVQNLQNLGAFLGTGNLKVTRGKNQGHLQGTGLELTVGSKFTNQGNLLLRHINGSGSLINENILKLESSTDAPSVIECNAFKNSTGTYLGEAITGKLTGEHIVFGSRDWHNDAGAGIEAGQVEFKAVAKAGRRSRQREGQAVNAGILKTKQLDIKRQSFTNDETISTNTLTLTGKSFKNSATGDMEVSNTTIVDLHELVNAGIIDFKGAFNGTVQNLHNKGQFELQGDGNVLGTKLINDGIFIAEKRWQWNGQDFINNRNFAMHESAVTAKRQLINRGNVRLHKGKLQMSHLLNLNVIDDAKDLHSGFRSISNSATNQSAEFKSGLMENRGLVDFSQKGKLKFTGKQLLNTGTITSQHSEVNLQKLLNEGTFTAQQNLSGCVTTLDNSGSFKSAKGLIDLKGDHLLNSGNFTGHLGVRYNGRQLTNKKGGQIASTKDLNFTLSEASSNAGEIFSVNNQGSLTVNGQNITNTGMILGKDLKLTAEQLLNKGTIQAQEKITGDINILDNKHLLQTTKGAMVLQGNTLTNSGKILGTGGLSYKGTTVTNASGAAIGSSQAVNLNFSKTLKNKGKIQGDKTINLTGREIFNWDKIIGLLGKSIWNISWKVENRGKIQLNELDLQGRYA
ncbi:MAG: hypothetical protein ABFQ95_07835, partial [Pseudomonadota bacterium]